MERAKPRVNALPLKGVILANERTSRLRPLTHLGNRYMLPIANKPMIFYSLEYMRRAGIVEVGVVLGPAYSEGIVEAVGDGTGLGLKVTYMHQREPKGVAHAIGLVKDFAKEDPFIVHYGNVILRDGINSMVEQFTRTHSDAVISLAKVQDPRAYGVVMTKNRAVVKLVEKPAQPPSNFVLVGTFGFTPVIFQAIRSLKMSWRGQLEITEAIQCLVDKGCEVGFVEVTDWWTDETLTDLLEANQFTVRDVEDSNKGRLEGSVTISGKVGIEEGSVLRGPSSIRGPAIIGKNSEIGPNVYIGPYTSIGENCVIRGTEIENSIVMNGTRIDCKGQRILDSLIGSYSVITSSRTAVGEKNRLVLGERTHIDMS